MNALPGSRAAEDSFEVENVGRVSIMQLVVGISSDEFGLLASDRDIESAAGSAALPNPPERPLDQQEHLMRSLSSHSLMPAAARQFSPVKMRWHDRPLFGGDEGTYGCEDFRPGRVYRDSIGLLPRKHQRDGSFEVTASGNDMAQIVSQVTIRIERSLWSGRKPPFPTSCLTRSVRNSGVAGWISPIEVAAAFSIPIQRSKEAVPANELIDGIAPAQWAATCPG